jgi:hypothetical protein
LAILAKKLAQHGLCPTGRDHHHVSGGLHGSLGSTCIPPSYEILTFAVEYLELYRPITKGHNDMLVHPRPEPQRLYTHLRQRLEWIGTAPEAIGSSMASSPP